MFNIALGEVEGRYDVGESQRVSVRELQKGENVLISGGDCSHHRPRGNGLPPSPPCAQNQLLSGVARYPLHHVSTKQNRERGPFH